MIDEKKLIEDLEEQYKSLILEDDTDFCKIWQIKQDIKIIEAQPQVSEWIPCSERLPDRNGTYLVTVCSYDETANINYMYVEHGNSDGSFLHYGTKKPRAKSGKYIVAWMPLPEPYKEASRND